MVTLFQNIQNSNNAHQKQKDNEDWQLKSSFIEKRHNEPIEGLTPVTETWRMKERVGPENIKQFYL